MAFSGLLEFLQKLVEEEVEVEYSPLEKEAFDIFEVRMDFFEKESVFWEILISFLVK